MRGSLQMNLARSHWAWLAATLMLWSVWDYYEHIARPGSPFEAAPGAWFGFTFASLTCLLVIARVTSWLIERFTPVPELPASTIGVLHAVAAHLVVTGPLWDRVFWDGGLRFNAVAVPAGVAALLYLAFRGAFALFARRLGVPPSNHV